MEKHHYQLYHLEGRGRELGGGGGKDYSIAFIILDVYTMGKWRHPGFWHA